MDCSTFKVGNRVVIAAGPDFDQWNGKRGVVYSLIDGFIAVQMDWGAWPESVNFIMRRPEQDRLSYWQESELRKVHGLFDI